MDFSLLLAQITRGFSAFTWGNALMIAVGLVLIGLAVVKEYEPVLLLPIGFGAILTNLHTDMDYATLCAELPPGVEPGYDRMSFAC